MVSRYVIWFQDIEKNDISLVGVKCFNIGEMMKLGMPVPLGFAVTVEAFNDFLISSGIKETIQTVLAEVNTTGFNSDKLRIIGKNLGDFLIWEKYLKS